MKDTVPEAALPFDQEGSLFTWPDPTSAASDQPTRCYGLLRWVDRETGSLSVLRFDPDDANGMRLIVEDLPPGTKVTHTGEHGLDPLFERTILGLPQAARERLCDAESWHWEEERAIDRLSEDLVRRLARAKNRTFLAPILYHLDEHWRAVGTAHDQRDLRMRRRRRFYEVILPAFLETASLAETLQLLRDAPDERRQARPNWCLIVERAYLPILTLPQAGRRHYRQILHAPNSETGVQRARRLRADLRPQSDTLLDTIIELLERYSNDEAIFRWLDPAGWCDTLWRDLRPHLAPIRTAEMARILGDHWSTPFFPTLVGAFCASLPIGAPGHAERQAAIHAIVAALASTSYTPYPREKDRRRLKAHLPELRLSRP